MTRPNLQVERVGCRSGAGVGMVVRMIVAKPDVEAITARREGECGTGKNEGLYAKL